MALGVLADGCQQRLVTPARLISALLLKPRLRWRRALLSILDDVAAGAYSFLEYTYLRKVERAPNLPMGRRQVPVDTPGGRFCRDVLYESFAVACELDGRLGHEDFVGRARDMRRDNVASDLELVTYRFGYLPIIDTLPNRVDGRRRTEPTRMAGQSRGLRARLRGSLENSYAVAGDPARGHECWG